MCCSFTKTGHPKLCDSVNSQFTQPIESSGLVLVIEKKNSRLTTRLSVDKLG